MIASEDSFFEVNNDDSPNKHSQESFRRSDSLGLDDVSNMTDEDSKGEKMVYESVP